MAKRFRRTSKNIFNRAIRTIHIQAGSIEGAAGAVSLENMFTGTPVNLSTPGTTNAYKQYDTQVTETYKKYNGRADFGCPQLRTIVDLRSSLISGEGVSISAQNEATAKWIDNFLEKNELKSMNFLNAVKSTEMVGQSIMMLKPKIDDDDSTYIKVTRIPYAETRPYRPIYKDKILNDEIEAIEFKINGMWQRATLGNYIYIRTGGDDFNSQGPTTKVGIVLTDIENYDRALRDMRRNNHIFAHITPAWETKSEAETGKLKKWLQSTKWTIGKAFMGTAKFRYETPSSSAHENLIAELTVTIKSISATTGVPVHWLGYTDLMSNRSTADSLYELVKHATISERMSWEKSMRELIIKAQELYINSGGIELPGLDKDIQVRLPLIDFAEFLNRVKALSLAYADDAISMDDYRNMLPGIDPFETEKAVDIEQKESQERLVKSGLFPIKDDGEENGEE